MVLPTWTHDALQSEPQPYEATHWRCVEAQHLVSTQPLVDTLEEQSLLEDMLEETKPPAPPEAAGLHYLYMTPFRYGPYPSGSRFRRAGQTPGVLYASSEAKVAVIETAFHTLLFYKDSPSTPFPKNATEYTTFDVPITSERSIDLTKPPFDQVTDLWTHPTDYSPCQELEEIGRANGIELILYQSVRDPEGRLNSALLSCGVFSSKHPSDHQSWKLWLNEFGVHVIHEFYNEKFSLSPQIFSSDPRLAGMDWAR